MPSVTVLACLLKVGAITIARDFCRLVSINVNGNVYRLIGTLSIERPAADPIGRDTVDVAE
jgi:hypothetical protein